MCLIDVPSQLDVESQAQSRGLAVCCQTRVGREWILDTQINIVALHFVRRGFYCQELIGGLIGGGLSSRLQTNRLMRNDLHTQMNEYE